MKSNCRSLILLFVSPLALLFGCDDGPTGGAGDTVYGKTPLGVGMYWEYEVYDSLAGVTDTVQVSQVDILTVPSGGFAWVEHQKRIGSFSPDRFLKAVNGDTLDIYVAEGVDTLLPERFVFPLTPGEFWTGPLDSLFDTTVVADSEGVATPLRYFDAAARVERSWAKDLEGGGKWTTTWVTLAQGIVKRHFYERVADGGDLTVTRNEVWSLTRCDLKTFPLDAFPDAIGTRWRYERFDSLPRLTDTITVTIARHLYRTRDSAVTLWEVDDGRTLDTLYLKRFGSWLRLYEDTSGQYADAFEFPLAVGRYWGIIFSQSGTGPASPNQIPILPIPETVGKMPISVPAGSFPSAFENATATNGFNWYSFSSSWLVPNYGIVKRRYQQMNLGPVEVVTWELLSYTDGDPPDPR